VPADLAQLDFAVPIGALDQADHDPALVLPRQIYGPVDQRNGALGIGLKRQAEALPATREQLAIGHQVLDDVQRQFQPLGLFRVDGKVNVGAAGRQSQLLQHRHQHRARGRGVEEVIAREQRGKLDRNARRSGHTRTAFARNPGEGCGIGAAIALCIVKGHCRFAQHVEAVGQATLALWRGAFQRFVDGAAKDELPAQVLHRLQRRLADHRFAQPPHRALERGGKAIRLLLLQHLPCQHEREGGGIDESAVAFAHMFGPVDPAQLVLDQRVRRGRIGDAQQRLSQAHQGYALVRAQAIGLHHGLQPAGLLRPRPFDQPGGDAARFGMDRARRAGLGQPLGNAGFLIHAIGFAQGGAVNRCGHGVSLALVAMETNRARPKIPLRRMLGDLQPASMPSAASRGPRCSACLRQRPAEVL